MGHLSNLYSQFRVSSSVEHFLSFVCRLLSLVSMNKSLANTVFEHPMTSVYHSGQEVCNKKTVELVELGKLSTETNPSSVPQRTDNSSFGVNYDPIRGTLPPIAGPPYVRPGSLGQMPRRTTFSRRGHKTFYLMQTVHLIWLAKVFLTGVESDKCRKQRV